MDSRAGAAALAFLGTLLLAACTAMPPASVPTEAPAAGTAPAPEPAAPSTGDSIASAAATLIGTPYHFGGADAAGFDCSGLALYAYSQAGLAIPRTAAAQRRAARPVPLTQLAPGDLVFFRIRSRHVNHVGVYSGGGRFIHAPRAGLAVSYADLGSGYYARHLVSAGRFW
jgi:murein DD-endopeptidase